MTDSRYRGPLGAWWHGLVRGHRIIVDLDAEGRPVAYRCETCDVLAPFWRDWKRFIERATPTEEGR